MEQEQININGIEFRGIRLKRSMEPYCWFRARKQISDAVIFQLRPRISWATVSPSSQV